MSDFPTRLARALMVMGATLGIASIAVTVLEVRINLPDWLIQVAMVKLAVIGALGLLGGGAMLGRYALRQQRLEAESARAIGEGADETQPRQRERDSVPLRSHSRKDGS